MQLKRTIDEAEIVQRCMQGDEQAYSILYYRYAKPIYLAVLRIVNQAAEAEDIVQEAFVSAFEQISRLKKLDNFEGWVKRIAINQGISLLRKRKMVFMDDSHLIHIADEPPDLEEELLFQAQIEDIKEAIQSLSDGYRTIVSLHLFENMAQEEIAQMLGISHATVRSQYHRAKKKIFLTLQTKNCYGTG